MSVTTAPTATTPTSPITAVATRRSTSLRRSTVAVGAVAAVTTTAAAAGLHAAGVSFAVQGEAIPLAGFAQLAFVGAVIGGLVLAVLNRRSSAPHRRFLQVTAVLTAASCIPSVAWPDDASTKVALVALHLLAAAIVVPVLARHAD